MNVYFENSGNVPPRAFNFHLRLWMAAIKPSTMVYFQNITIAAPGLRALVSNLQFVKASKATPVIVNGDVIERLSKHIA
ncbi:MAG: hypothetical protein H8E46_09205 [FCB group bacterium]|nr:hypothetical protein [FCB group bacterium]